MEALLFILTGLCVWGFAHIALFRLCKATWLTVVLCGLFGWLFYTDLAFYLGQHGLASWPLRPLIFRGGVCIAVWIWIWREHQKKPGATTLRRR